MTSIKEKARNSFEKFVEDHKVGIAITVTAVTTFLATAKMSRYAVGQREDFMREKGILDEFNAMFEDEDADL